jgi:hypothetical protein
VTFAAAIVFALSAEPGGARSPDGSPAPLTGPAAESPHQALRCNPEAHRVIEPLALEEGREFEVLIHFDYLCPEGTKPIVFVIAVEDSDMLEPPGFGGRQLDDNLQEALTDFVEAMDYDNGTMGGLVLYTGTASIRVPVEGGNGGRQSLLAAIRTISPGGPTARAAADAVDTAAEMLRNASGPEGALKVMLIVDAGASLDDTEAVIARCAAAKAEGVHVAVTSLREAEGRLRDCSEESSYRQSAREGGQDLQEHLSSLGEGFVNMERADGVLVADTLATAMSYVIDSGQPPPTSSFAGEISWDFAAPAPDGGQDVRYRIKPSEMGPGQMLSTSATVTLLYADGSYGVVPLENPEVCVYRAGRPQECPDTSPTEEPTPTDPAPGETPTATVEPTAEVSATATTNTPVMSIFLPAVRRERD